MKAYEGLYSRVAKQLGVTLSSVTRVAKGQRKSARIEAALLEELDRAEREANEAIAKTKTKTKTKTK